MRPKIAGMESTANSTSVIPIATIRMSSGVAWRRPRTLVVSRAPSPSAATGTMKRATRSALPFPAPAVGSARRNAIRAAP